MIFICKTHRHNDFSDPNLKQSAKRFLYPELFESHLSSFFCFGLIFATFVGIEFNSSTGTTMFILHFHAQTPTFAEVIAQVERNARNVKTSMRIVVGMCRCVGRA